MKPAIDARSPAPVALAAIAVATALALAGARAGNAQQRSTASGRRLLTMTQRVHDSEGDRHSLRTRLREAALTRRDLRCANLPRGEQYGVPVPMSDGTITLVTRSPTGVAWFADGTFLRHVEVPGTVVGTAIEGADGRVIVVDNTPSIRAYAPDGTLRAARALPSAPLYGASSLNDGTLVLPIEGPSGTDLAVLSADLSLLTRSRLPSPLQTGPGATNYFFHGAHGSLWFATTGGPHFISGTRALAEPLAFARSANAAWQIDEDTIAVQYGTGSPTELRFTSRTGAVRGTVMLHDQIFLLPRGHIGVARPHRADPATAPATGPARDAGTPATNPLAPLLRPPYGRYGSSTLPPPTHTELIVYDRRGATVTRALLPPRRPLGVLMDPDEALLVMTQDGHAISVEPGGAIRWDADLAITPTQDVVALPDGGFAVAVSRPRPGVCTVAP